MNAPRLATLVSVTGCRRWVRLWVALGAERRRRIGHHNGIVAPPHLLAGFFPAPLFAVATSDTSFGFGDDAIVITDVLALQQTYSAAVVGPLGCDRNPCAEREADLVFAQTWYHDRQDKRRTS
jgi:hypothetical protein